MLLIRCCREPQPSQARLDHGGGARAHRYTYARVQQGLEAPWSVLEAPARSADPRVAQSGFLLRDPPRRITAASLQRRMAMENGVLLAAAPGSLVRSRASIPPRRRATARRRRWVVCYGPPHCRSSPPPPPPPPPPNLPGSILARPSRVRAAVWPMLKLSPPPGRNRAAGPCRRRGTIRQGCGEAVCVDAAQEGWTCWRVRNRRWHRLGSELRRIRPHPRRAAAATSSRS